MFGWLTGNQLEKLNRKSKKTNSRRKNEGVLTLIIYNKVTSIILFIELLFVIVVFTNFFGSIAFLYTLHLAFTPQVFEQRQERLMDSQIVKAATIMPQFATKYKLEKLNETQGGMINDEVASYHYMYQTDQSITEVQHFLTTYLEQNGYQMVAEWNEDDGCVYGYNGEKVNCDEEKINGGYQYLIVKGEQMNKNKIYIIMTDHKKPQKVILDVSFFRDN